MTLGSLDVRDLGDGHQPGGTGGTHDHGTTGGNGRGAGTPDRAGSGTTPITSTLDARRGRRAVSASGLDVRI